MGTSGNDPHAVFLPGLNGEELTQGDIVDVLPVGGVPMLRVSRTFSHEKDRPDPKGMVYDYPLAAGVRTKPTPELFKREPETIIFHARLQRCIVLSEDCVSLAKASNQAMSLKLDGKARGTPWHVAPVRPWPPDSQIVTLDDGSRVPLAELISSGQVKRYVEIPAIRNTEDALVLERGYVDLRFITPVMPEVFNGTTRVASMTDFGKAVLWVRIYQFFSGREFPSGGVTCQHCGKVTALTGPDGAEPESAKKD